MLSVHQNVLLELVIGEPVYTKQPTPGPGRCVKGTLDLPFNASLVGFIHRIMNNDVIYSEFVQDI